MPPTWADKFQSLIREVMNTELADLRKIGEETYFKEETKEYTVYVAYEIRKAAMLRYMKQKARAERKVSEQELKVMEEILDQGDQGPRRWVSASPRHEATNHWRLLPFRPCAPEVCAIRQVGKIDFPDARRIQSCQRHDRGHRATRLASAVPPAKWQNDALIVVETDAR
ncbi:MAG: hypothetical protein IPJ85_16980 [Flavobacteriales bacterium]|nr:hypothetical protein [Flavobacteriales bacterium]